MDFIAAIGEREISRPMLSEQASGRAFFAISALLFFVSAAVTIVWCGSMSEMGDMPMPGGWTMAMAWMLMPGQTWLGANRIFPRHVDRDDAAILDASALALLPGS